uniref:Uncharacterized protein n=1 Tax=Arundo donax TaxID=35708 RepID=A0A0A9Q736_ARUDO
MGVIFYLWLQNTILTFVLVSLLHVMFALIYWQSSSSIPLMGKTALSLPLSLSVQFYCLVGLLLKSCLA